MTRNNDVNVLSCTVTGVGRPVATARPLLGISVVKVSAHILCLAWLAFAGPASVSASSWTNATGDASGFWTNGILWGNASSLTYPGGGDTAYLTNQFSGTATNILNAGIGGTGALTTLALSNVLGETWLIVTNGASATTILTNSTFVLGNGGRLQIDSGGVVTGLTSFTWSGTNGAVVLNNGGSLFTGNAITLNSGGMTGLVTSVSATGGVWNLNGQTMTFANSLNALNVNRAILTNIGTVTIGNAANNVGNSLTIGNGGGFFSGKVTIGNVSGANSNSYNVGGNGLLSTVSNGTVVVGNTIGASFNTMTVTNAYLLTGDVEMGNGSGPGASSNTVRVLANSTWNMLNHIFYVGDGAPNAWDNALIVDSGLLTNAAVLYCGGSGSSFSQLLVTNGGIVAVSGLYSGDSSGSNSAVTVTGAGSVLKEISAGAFQIGDGAGGSNNLTIADGGVVIGLASSISVGSGTGGSNWVLVTGSGSVWSNVVATGGNGFDIGLSAGVDNSLAISNGGTVYVVGAGAVSRIGVAAGPNSNRVTVTGSDSVWTNSGVLRVGEAGSSNSLTIAGGGTVFSTAGTIGTSGSKNTVLVTDPGSSWQITGGGALTLGSSGGNNNSLTISNGARLFSGAIAIGNAAGSSNNSYNVGGLGLSSTVSNGGTLTLGTPHSGFNTLTVTNGTLVTGGSYVFIGYDSAGNQANLQTNGTWNAGGQDFYIGVVDHTGAASNNTVTVNGGVLTNVHELYVGNSAGGPVSSYNSLIVTNGGSATASAGMIIDSSGGSLSAGVGDATVVTGTGSVLKVGSAGIFVGDANITGGSNSLTVANGGLVISGGALIVGNNSTSGTNMVLVTGSGSVLSNVGAVYISDRNSSFNSLLISNGGLMISTGPALVGGAAGSADISNSVLVTGSGSVWSNTSTLGLAISSNTVTVARGGTIFATAANVGTSTGSGNLLLVTDPDSILQINGGALTVGSSGGNNNSLLISNGGLLSANSLVIGGGTGNTISNVGGIYQFTGAPTITPTVSGMIDVDNGTISYRATTVANVAALSGMTYDGTNTFMLNGASNTAAGVSQTYTFNAIVGNPTNYANLVLVNGQTAYSNTHGGNITIGANGSMLVSNTMATISGLVTNNGSLSFVNASATFQSQVYNNGAWITDPTTNIFDATYTVATNGFIAMSAGDVMIFKSNFVNQSLQPSSNNTVNGKFLFTGISLTQTFVTAGIDDGPGGHNPAPDLGDTNTLGGYFNTPSNNFQLGTLEIANDSTVEVADAFVPGQRGALYLDNLDIDGNGLLIISNDVSVYFDNSNSWSYANNIVLLGGAELHLLVPEPSVLILWFSGLLTLLVAHRRRRSRQSVNEQTP